MTKKERKKYTVLLHRSYSVEVLAENANQAREVAEFFIGDPKDASNEKEQEKINFKIQDIELLANDAPEII